MYIIQTNTSFINKINGDFQSLVYRITRQTWEEFKEYILSEENFTQKIVKGTMTGCTKPSRYKVTKILINDNFHLEVILTGKSEMDLINTKYFMMDDEVFSNLL